MVLKTVSNARLCAAWWLAGVAWLFHLLGSFVLVDWYCQHAMTWPSSRITLLLHVLSVICLAMALGGLMLAIGNKQQLSHAGQSSHRFLALGGMGFSAFLIAIILIQAWGNFVLEPCQ